MGTPGPRHHFCLLFFSSGAIQNFFSLIFTPTLPRQLSPPLVADGSHKVPGDRRRLVPHVLWRGEWFEEEWTVLLHNGSKWLSTICQPGKRKGGKCGLISLCIVHSCMLIADNRSFLWGVKVPNWNIVFFWSRNILLNAQKGSPALKLCRWTSILSGFYCHKCFWDAGQLTNRRSICIQQIDVWMQKCFDCIKRVNTAGGHAEDTKRQTHSQCRTW